MRASTCINAVQMQSATVFRGHGKQAMLLLVTWVGDLVLPNT